MEDIAPYDARIAEDPEDGPAYLARGKCHMRNGSWGAAKTDFEKALTLRLDRNKPSSERGESYESPEESDCELQLGAAKVELGDLEGALQNMERGVQLDPRERAYTARGAVKLLRGDVDGALSDLDRALRLDPGSVRARQHRATAFERLTRLPEAEADLGKVLEQNPMAEPARTRWIEVRKRQGKSADPATDIQPPKNAMARYLRGVTLAQQRAYPAALAEYSAALALDPSLAAAYLGRGSAYEGTAAYDLAIADFREYERLEPKSHLGPYFRGHALVLAGKPEEALEAFERALEVCATDGATIYQLGVTHAKLVDHRAAIERFTKGIAGGTGGALAAWVPWFMLERGKSYRALGMEAEARADFEATLEKDPTNQEARAALGLPRTGDK